jgi:ClpP class serine protease
MKKQRPVLRLTSELYNTPHLISELSFSTIATYLDMRNSGRLDAVPVDDDGEGTDEPVIIAGKTGIINIHGSLTNKPVVSLCGTTGASYANILGQMTELVALGCKTIVLDVDSGGGEAFNCFQSADAMRALADSNGVYLIAYVQSMAASAAYALACCADEVVCHPQGQVGSIGVLVALMNDTKALEKEGYVRSFVTAGANKIPFDDNGDFRKGFLEEIQARVDDLYAQFCEHVSLYTGLTVEDVQATEASVFSGPVGMKMGLVNKVMTNEEFATYITTR